MQQNSKSQNANVTKQKKTDCKYDKIQKHICGSIQKDKVQ